MSGLSESGKGWAIYEYATQCGNLVVLAPGPKSPPAKCRDPSSPKPDRRRALELLASCRDGCTEAIMVAHGFTIGQMVELVRAGLASPTGERVRAGSKAIEVARVMITEADSCFRLRGPIFPACHPPRRKPPAPSSCAHGGHRSCASVPSISGPSRRRTSSPPRLQPLQPSISTRTSGSDLLCERTEGTPQQGHGSFASQL
jgi:hypothetical protein